ncbi:hypothetical protein HMN09_00762200 [Mycena chlorophos]|uniref:Uncharacterized protein n=1 Tax=Mycena chlorophos TaxID=658473 RepID=A0A8H6SUE8_MYCCL|nr:hypothetical protein HMN09_00762200 [Mycena chlorophos]
MSSSPPPPAATEAKTPPTTPTRRSRILNGFRTSPQSSPNGKAAASAAAPEATAQPAQATSGTAPSPPPSPTKQRRPPLGIANVANIFVRMRRASESAKSKSSKSWHIQSSSGSEPQSHPAVLEGASEEREPVEHRDVFICADAVNVGQLLRATRNALMEDAESMGANALVDEHWEVTICGPKHRRNGSFKVEVSYSGAATHSEQPDPHRPVALDKAQGVPGLMTCIPSFVQQPASTDSPFDQVTYPLVPHTPERSIHLEI